MDTLDIKIIQKYKSRSNTWLKNKAQFWFNRFIRLRDQNDPCISCGRYTGHDAGHYYSAGHYSGLRFNEINVNLQCVHCNKFLHSNAIEYRKGLIRKYGIEAVENLDMLSKINRVAKDDKYLFIEIIETYKIKCKELE
jgi:hypothetical protein